LKKRFETDLKVQKEVLLHGIFIQLAEDLRTTHTYMRQYEAGLGAPAEFLR
jgi:hypothetical protein